MGVNDQGVFSSSTELMIYAYLVPSGTAISQGRDPMIQMERELRCISIQW